MVIELDCGVNENPQVQRDKVNTREIPVIECLDGNVCPVGYIIDTNAQDCECIPDCANLVQECGPCGDSFPFEWVVTSSNDNSANVVGFCGCTTVQFGDIYNCGCPPWFSYVQANGNFATVDYCDVLRNQPCYTGDLNIVQESVMVDCQNMNSDGKITASVTIEVTDGACVSITQLQNCQLSGGEDFVFALAAEYGADAAFCAEAGETTIELEFLFDPQGTIPTWAYLDDNGDEQFQPLLAPEDLCPTNNIPTLSTWMIITLGLFMAISGLLFVKRKEVRKVLGAFMMSF
jgi:hypothetical protein